jgi:hypothetical protein
VPSFAGLDIGGGCPRVIQRLPRAPPWATLCRPPRLVCGVGVCDEVGSRFSVASSTRNRRLCVNLENWSIWHIFRKSTKPYSRYPKAVLYDPGQNKCFSWRSRSREVKREPHNGTLRTKILRLKRCRENTWRTKRLVPVSGVFVFRNGGYSQGTLYFAKRDNLWFSSYTVNMQSFRTFKIMRSYRSL